MARAAVFVQSSIWEGPGHALIEALAVGTPLVATDCPTGPREVLEGGALGSLVPVGDVEAMAHAIRQSIDNPMRGERLAGIRRESASR
ncbi:MAG: glycosyltransferase, partial [Anaerolineae bacterium]|nr:glycosyltransferase [Anaerolineae bacterium]NIN97579.1 glycosyltransferase [Anaerolineae bacterium]NIQ80505.1 glycosyltransferase [Anaerolineae bacterium]